MLNVAHVVSSCAFEGLPGPQIDGHCFNNVYGLKLLNGAGQILKDV